MRTTDKPENTDKTNAAHPSLGKHTSGPWEWKDGHRLQGDLNGPIQTILEYEGCTVKRDAKVNEFEPVSEANKRLIAAAPELLEFAKRAEDVLEYYNENKGVTRDNALCGLYELARAAIAKAESI